jgi:hypothetical protein
VIVRKPPFNAASVLVEICELAKSYGCTEIVSDRVAQGFMNAGIAAHGLTWRASQFDKSQLYLNVLPLFGSGQIRLLDDMMAIDQFLLLERRAGSFGGKDRVDAKGGRAEDLANAIAGVASLLTKPLSGAEGWLEYYRRLAGAEGSALHLVPSPEFGYQITTSAKERVRVPEGISWLYLIDGASLLVPENRIVEVSKEDATAFGQRGWERLGA